MGVQIPSRTAILLLATALAACHGLPAPKSVVATAAPLAFAVVQPATNALPDLSPASLTTTDGMGLAIPSLLSTTRIYGPLAETEVRLTFENPSPKRIEGRFRFLLPPRASLSHLAMKIDGQWREADAAELSAARETYEAIVHRRRDPLLVEQWREREITARIFPIEGGQKREITLTYVAEIGPHAPVLVPLRGLPVVGDLQVSVLDGATEPVFLHLTGERPTADVRFAPSFARGEATVARSGELVVASVPSAVAPPETDPMDAVVFLLSTSASEASDLSEKAKWLGALAGSLVTAGTAATTRASVVAYDQTQERIYDGDLGTLARAADPGSALTRAVISRGALGAHDLEAGLTTAATEARRIGAKRVVLVGGGAGTAGSVEPKRLRAAASALSTSGVVRLDVLATSRLADARVYVPLVSSEVFPREGLLVADALHASPEAVALQLMARLRAEAVAIEGATWSSQTSLRAVFPSTSHVVLATVPVGAPVRLRVNGETTQARVTEAPRRVLEHALARSKLSALVQRGEAQGFDDPLRKEVLQVARDHRLASPFTALMVVESEADRQLLRRVEATAAAARSPNAARANVAGAAGVSAKRAVHVSHTTKTPSIRMSMCRVSGRLPPESIRRQVREQFGVYRGCYAEGLLRRGPTLTGRVSVRFVIDPQGKVVSARDEGSELADPKVVACIVQAFTQLTFAVLNEDPQFIQVLYPLLLTPDDRQLGRTPTPEHLAFDLHGGWNGFREQAPPPPPPSPWSEEYAEAKRSITLPRAQASGSVNAARAFMAREPSAAAWTLLGEAFEAAGDPTSAARAYGSLADLYPERAEMIRSAAVRIDHARPGDPTALALLRRAAEDRPDQPSSHHLLGITLLRAGQYDAAFDAIAGGVVRTYEGRYEGAAALLRSDLRLVAAAWADAEPARRPEMVARMAKVNVPSLDSDLEPSLRASLTWETDTSDLGLSVVDAPEHVPSHTRVSHASDGFGPELVFFDSGATRSIGVELRSRGTAGHVLGVAHVIRYEKNGAHLSIEPRPFVLMNEGSELSLGSVASAPAHALAQERAR